MKRRISKDIDRLLRQEKRDSYKEKKLLLLGTGEAGKSTFVKQMRIIHGAGYGVDDKRKFVKLVYENIFRAMHSLIYAMDSLKVQYEEPSSKEKADLLCSVGYETLTTFEKQYADAIKDLWKDAGIT